MKMFECRTRVDFCESLEAFFEEIKLSADDLIITNQFLLDGDAADICGAQIVYQEKFGAGEPSDEMLMHMRGAVQRPYSRVIGVGGGTVLDLAKLMCLSFEEIDTCEDFQQLMMGKKPVVKACSVLLVPTTCGTGSEMTNVAVMLLKSLNIKMGLANEALYAERAALIPAMLATLPYRPMILSAIDALIHACESWLSPKASALTKPFSAEAMSRLLTGFAKLAETGTADMETLGSFLIASNMAGIAFGNAGCGMVHAMSYPIGGLFHLPHGEANYEVFLPVLRFYDGMEDCEPLDEMKKLMADVLGCAPKCALDNLESLLQRICARRTLAQIGATVEICTEFARDVCEKQQRLLGNAMRPVSEKDVLRVYLSA